MSFLENVSSGVIEEPYFLVIYGPEGVGKSTFASKAPKPIFMDLEKGTSRLSVSRLPGFEMETRPTLDLIYQAIEELANGKHDYKTFVIDSLSKLEPIIQKAVIAEGQKKDANILSIEDFGYGKGIIKAAEVWHEFMTKLSMLRNRMNVILIGHSIVRKHDNPQTNSAYDRFTININEKAAAVVKATVSEILFATEEVATKKDESKKVRAYGNGTRVLYTERRPAFDAKNRSGLPFELPLEWEDFDNAAKKGEPDSADAIKARIKGLLSAITDKNILEAVDKELKVEPANVKRLAQFENRLNQIVTAEEK